MFNELLNDNSIIMKLVAVYGVVVFNFVIKDFIKLLCKRFCKSMARFVNFMFYV